MDHASRFGSKYHNLLANTSLNWARSRFRTFFLSSTRIFRPHLPASRGRRPTPPGPRIPRDDLYLLQSPCRFVTNSSSTAAPGSLSTGLFDRSPGPPRAMHNPAEKAGPARRKPARTYTNSGWTSSVRRHGDAGAVNIHALEYPKKNPILDRKDPGGEEIAPSLFSSREARLPVALHDETLLFRR